MSTLRYLGDHWDTLGPEVRTHLEIVGVSVLAAAVCGLALGIAAARSERIEAAATAVTSAILTLPSFALFGFLTIYLGIGDTPVEIGLALYALLPVLRNTCAGIHAVRPAVVEAAVGMGMNARQVLTRIELPLALPVIIAGLRQATVMVVAIATVGAAVGSDNLGRPIFEAMRAQANDSDKILAVVLLIVAIGLSADSLLALAQRLLSRGRITRVPA